MKKCVTSVTYVTKSTKRHGGEMSQVWTVDELEEVSTSGPVAAAQDMQADRHGP